MRSRYKSLRGAAPFETKGRGLFQNFCYQNHQEKDNDLKHLVIELNSHSKDDLLGNKENLNFYSRQHFETMLDQHYEEKREIQKPEPKEETGDISLRNQTEGLQFSGMKNNVSELEEQEDFLTKSGGFDFLSNYKG